MSSKLKTQKHITVVVIFLLLFSVNGFTQNFQDVLRFQISFGGNLASENGFAESYSGKGFNIPTINIGTQYMFKKYVGAKLDLGFNRIKGSDNDFKINYTRVNAQVVYDYSRFLSFLPEDVKTEGHIGPGFTFVSPLGDTPDNDQNYFNIMIGTDFIYALSRTTSVFLDVSYIHGFTRPEVYSPVSEGLGAFNGSMITFTIGISLSLSECYYCD